MTRPLAPEDRVTAASDVLAAVSRWIDEHPANAVRAPEAQAWGRSVKPGEEVGEVIAALIGVTGQNPRKGVNATWEDVVKELTDTAVAALSAIEHLTGNQGLSMDVLLAHIDFIGHRAGLLDAPPQSITELLPEHVGMAQPAQTSHGGFAVAYMLERGP